MYAPLRRIHLHATFTLMAFIVMYFVTGYVITHSNLFGKASESNTERTVSLDPSVLSSKPDEESFGLALQAAIGATGRCNPAKRRNSGKWEFRFTRPGFVTEAVVAPDIRSAKVTERRFGWQRTLTEYHRLHGYSGGWIYIAWAVVCDASAVAMIVFAVTGLLLWYRMIRHRTVGWIVLFAGFSLTAGTIGYLLMAR